MGQVIHFRVLLDHDDDVFRDIEISSDQNFEDLHLIIQEAFAFDNSQMASFYLSNEEWEKGREIGLMDMSEAKEEDDEPMLSMASTRIGDIVKAKGQKLVYVFDFLLMWCFFVDVIKIEDDAAHMILPRITQSYGIAPDQYSKTPDFSFDTDVIEDSEDEDDEDDIEKMFKVLGDDD